MKEDNLKTNGMHDGANAMIFQNASILHSKMTETESLLWERLKGKSLGFKFRRQHPINRYILDFYSHVKRLSVELDGGYHLNKEQALKDKERTEYLNSVGITELRFKNSDVLNDIETVIKKLNNKFETSSL